jgi:hypothetical protein
MNKFLLAKHWQLFFLICGIPLFFNVLIFISAFNHLSKENPTTAFDDFKFFPIMMLFMIGIMFGWFWAIAITLQYKIPTNIKMKPENLRYSLLFW